NEITQLIKPVTMASLKAFAVNLAYAFAAGKNSKNDKLQKTVFRYGTMAFAVVFTIIVLHTYYFVGNDVLNKSQELFEQRNQVREEIDKRKISAAKLAENGLTSQSPDAALW